MTDFLVTKTRVWLKVFLMMMLISTAACQSKYSEKQPEGVEDASAPLEERVKQKADIDRFLGEAQRHVDFIQFVLNKFKEIHRDGNSSTDYSPLDFFTDLSLKMKKPLPKKKDGSYVSEVTYKFPDGVVEPECQTVQSRLTMHHRVGEQDDKSVTAAVTGEWSLKTCRSGDAYVPAFHFTQVGQHAKFKIEEEALKGLFKNVLLPEIHLGSECELATDPSLDQPLKSVICRNLKLNLSSTEIIQLESVKFSNEDSVPNLIEAHSTLLENGHPKMRFFDALTRDGRVVGQSEPIDQQTKPNAQTPPHN